MDVYEILMQDHRTIANIFGEIAATSNREGERRKQLFSDLWITLLTIHQFLVMTD